MSSMLDLEIRIRNLELQVALLTGTPLNTIYDNLQTELTDLIGTPLDANRDVPVEQEPSIEEPVTDPDA